jgi:predicted translation initiation factor SUI1
VAKRTEKTVLFLCTGNYFRSRFAEILFNSVAARMKLGWNAASRGLALERGANNVGPMAANAVQALETMGMRDADAASRFPIPVTTNDLMEADLIVALKQSEHLPLLQERFPAWIEKVEFWHIDDAPEVLGLVEREVMALTARLIGGGKGQEPSTQAVISPERGAATKKDVPNSAAVVSLGRQTKGRRGKGVTTVSDLPLDEAGLLELAAKLKKRCGTGGTVKDSRIEIQGDQRDRLAAVLESMGYRVKQVGG